MRERLSRTLTDCVLFILGATLVLYIVVMLVLL